MTRTLDATLTLVGGPTLLIEVGGFRLLTDPTFDGPGTYPAGAVTLEKRSGPAVAAAEIGRIDAVLLSHDQHSDNLDRSGRAMLSRAEAVFTTAIGAGRLGGGATGLRAWESARLERPGLTALQLTAAPARHGPPGVEPIAGEVIGFLVGADEPGDLIYITGDTVWYEGVAEVARRYRPRLVVPFAGSAKPRGAFHMTMDANDVIETASAFPEAAIAPVHNEGWAHFTESADELARALKSFGLENRMIRLEPGKPVTVTLVAGRNPQSRTR